MTSLKDLKPAPTFKASVLMPVAGSADVPVAFEFRHRTRTELADFIKRSADLDDHEIVMQTIAGWELDDQFNAKNVAQLLENYHAAARVIVERYIAVLAGTAQ